MTIFSAISIFIIFIFCNLTQLILIRAYNTNQEEDLLYNRSKEIRTFIFEQAKHVKGQELIISDDFFEKILENDEMVRILDENEKEIYNISKNFPDFQDGEMENGFNRINEEDENYLILRQQLVVDSFNGTIEIGRNFETFDEFMDQVFWILLLGTILSLVLSLIGGQLLAKKFLSPLAVMTKTMSKIEDQHFQERIPVMDTNDEFSQLSTIFNSMMDRIEVSMEQQKRFVEDASHELRTPLAIIHGHLSLLQRWGKNDKKVLDRSLQTSIKETSRVIELTNRLLLLTHTDKLEKEVNDKIACNAEETLNEVINDYELIYNKLKINKEDSVEPNVLLSIPHEQLKQVLIIILDNAIKYSGENKIITLRLSTQDNRYKIQIQDNGYGISQEDLPYIFDRFFRADKARSRELGGTGLGLSIAKVIIKKYKGEILAESDIGKGTTITIMIPCVIKQEY